MLLAIAPTIANRTLIEALRRARGSTVRSKHFGTDIVANGKKLLGNEMCGYSSLMSGARDNSAEIVAWLCSDV